MNLSRLNWLKNIKDPNPENWAYSDCGEMAIPEARILRLHGVLSNINQTPNFRLRAI